MAIDRANLDAARRAFSRRGWEAAHGHYQEAAASAVLPVDDLARLAQACWWLGRIEEYAEVGEHAFECYLEGDHVPDAARVALELGFSETVRGRDAVGAGWLARARRLLADAPDAMEHGFLLAIDATVALDSGALAEADDLARRVLELGERHHEATLQAHGLFLRGRLAIREGRVQEGITLLDEAMVPVLDGRTAPQWAGNLYCLMMQLCYEFGDLPRAQHWTDLTERWCRGLAPATLFTGICRVHRVQLMQVHGQWSRALVEGAAVAADLESLDVVAAAEAHYRLGELHRLRGELDAAGDAYRGARRLGRDPLPGAALLHLERGRAGAAAAMLDAALQSVRAPLDRAPLLAARLEVVLTRGRLGGLAGPAGKPLDAAIEHLVERLADELGDIADRHASPGWLAEARRWRGAVLVARGRHTAALPVLREARERWQRIDAPREVARVRVEIATVLEALGDAGTAREERDLAAATFTELGAERELYRLRRLEHRQRAPQDLSPREVEVLAAVSEGGANREVGARLHISERTVVRHLANTYLKLGVASRTAAVSWARDHALI